MAQSNDERWITEKNITKFEQQLKTEDNALRRSLLQGLLTWEENKLK